MKRDMDLVREILRRTEDMPFWKRPHLAEFGALETCRDSNGTLDLAKYLGLEGYTSEQISFHVKIMAQAGLLEAAEYSANTELKEYAGDVAWVPIELTWWGCEFLEAVREESRWDKVKEVMAAAGGFVFELAKAVALELMREQIHLLRS